MSSRPSSAQYGSLPSPDSQQPAQLPKAADSRSAVDSETSHSASLLSPLTQELPTRFPPDTLQSSPAQTDPAMPFFPDPPSASATAPGLQSALGAASSPSVHGQAHCLDAGPPHAPHPPERNLSADRLLDDISHHSVHPQPLAGPQAKCKARSTTDASSSPEPHQQHTAGQQQQQQSGSGGAQGKRSRQLLHDSDVQEKASDFAVAGGSVQQAESPMLENERKWRALHAVTDAQLQGELSFFYSCCISGPAQCWHHLWNWPGILHSKIPTLLSLFLLSSSPWQEGIVMQLKHPWAHLLCGFGNSAEWASSPCKSILISVSVTYLANQHQSGSCLHCPEAAILYRI